MPPELAKLFPRDKLGGCFKTRTAKIAEISHIPFALCIYPLLGGNYPVSIVLPEIQIGTALFLPKLAALIPSAFCIAAAAGVTLRRDTVQAR